MKNFFLFTAVIFVFLLTCFLLGYVGFRPGDFNFGSWITVSLNIALGSLPGVIYSINAGDVASGILWFPALAILLASLWYYFRYGNYILLFMGLEIWAFVGFFSVIVQAW